MSKKEKANKQNKPADKPGNRESKAASRWTPLWTAVILLTILTGAGVIYTISPAYRTRYILRDTTITYRQKRDGYNATYHIEARYGKVLATLTMQDTNPGKKITSGAMKASDFLPLYSVLEDVKSSGGKGYGLTISHGRKSRKVIPSPEVRAYLDKRFQLMEEQVLTRVIKNGAHGAKLLAQKVDSTKPIGVTEKLGAVFFNTTDRQLQVLRLASKSQFPLGELNFVETNFEGLGLAVEERGSLYFWERKNLQNCQHPLSEPWVKPGPHRKVIIRKESVYFQTPAKDDKYSVKRYDYVNRKLHTVVKSTSGIILDVTPDDKFILLSDHQDYRIASVYYTQSGSLMGTKIPYMPDEPWKAFSFLKKPTQVLAHSEGLLDLFYINDKGMAKVEKIAQERPGVVPEAISPDRSQLLFSSGGQTYFTWHFKDKKLHLITYQPQKMINPRFIPGNSGIIFTRFDGLYRFDLKHTGHNHKKIPHGKGRKGKVKLKTKQH